MDYQTKSFNVGRIACHTVLDGWSVLGRAGILRRYPDASEAETRQAFETLGLSLDQANTFFNILLAKASGEVVLVDTGEGGNPKGGQLPGGMQKAGILPEEVTMVVITHCHGDHVLGLMTTDHRPTFPNAKYAISSTELAFWQGRVDGGTVDQGAIITLIKQAGLREIEMDETILPGLTAIPLPGHTPGQIGLLFESDGERLMHLADLLHSPIQFTHPHWSPTFDFDPDVSVATRRAVLARAADEDVLAMFYHLSFPGLGRVRRRGDHFEWLPIEM